MTDVCSAQNDLGKTGFSFKLYTGPEFFMQTNMSGAPMPISGCKLSLVFNTTELEFGAVYVPKFLKQVNGNDNTHYKYIVYTHHYFIPSFHIHQRLFKKNKHVLSFSFGLSMIDPLRNPTDTLMNDGTHDANWSPTNARAIGIAFQLEPTIRYSYLLGSNIAFFAAPYFNAKVGRVEYFEPSQPHGMSLSTTYVPETNVFSFGIMAGFHFMVPFAKEHPGFFKDSKKKEKSK